MGILRMGFQLTFIEGILAFVEYLLCARFIPLHPNSAPILLARKLRLRGQMTCSESNRASVGQAGGSSGALAEGPAWPRLHKGCEGFASKRYMWGRQPSASCLPVSEMAVAPPPCRKERGPSLALPSAGPGPTRHGPLGSVQGRPGRTTARKEIEPCLPLLPPLPTASLSPLKTS